MSKPDGELSVRDGKRRVGGPVAAEVHDDPAAWMAGAHHVVLLIHGFNNNYDEARDGYRKFRDLLPGGTWRVGEVQWPGDADFGFVQWLDFLSYPAEIPDARDSAQRLAKYLARLAAANKAMELTLVGHSLGCRLILELLHLFETASAAPAPPIRHILLMAAAVPTALSEPGKRLQKAGAKARERLVLFSPDDLVLRFAFPAGQTLARLMHNDDGFYFEALGLDGRPASFASEPPVQARGNGHGDYWGDQRAADYLARKLGAAVPNDIAARSLTPRKTSPANELPSAILPVHELIAGE